MLQLRDDELILVGLLGLPVINVGQYNAVHLRLNNFSNIIPSSVTSSIKLSFVRVCNAVETRFPILEIGMLTLGK